MIEDVYQKYIIWQWVPHWDPSVLDYLLFAVSPFAYHLHMDFQTLQLVESISQLLVKAKHNFCGISIQTTYVTK